jgi:hypothetical protein
VSGVLRSTLALRSLVLAGSGLIVAATFVPVNGGGTSGYPYSIYDQSVQRELVLFVMEPLGVAIVASATALLLAGRLPLLGAGLLLAFGVESFLLFLAYLGIAAFGNPNFNSFQPGGLLGVIGALLLLLSGALAAAPYLPVYRIRRSSPSM